MKIGIHLLGEQTNEHKTVKFLKIYYRYNVTRKRLPMKQVPENRHIWNMKFSGVINTPHQRNSHIRLGLLLFQQ